MTNVPATSPHASIDALHAMKLLTRRQREQALAHPELPQLPAGATLSEAMMWLYRRQIVTSDDLASLSLSVARNYSGDELERRQAILNALTATLNRESFDFLRDATLLTPELYQRALDNLPAGVLLPTPGDALTWMVHVDLLPRTHLKSMAQRVQASGSSEARRAVGHAEARLSQHRQAVRGAVLDGLFPGPRLAWLIGAPLALAGMVWYVASGNSVPECDSAQTLAAVTRMLNTPDSASAASLQDVSQAGYASSQKIRGCLAMVEQDGEKMEFAYTIARDDSGSKSRIAYAGAQPMLVKARFDAIKDGDFVEQAKPLGREALEKAFRAGMDAVRGAPPPRVPFSLTQSRERTREIAEIEPLAPCREISPGVYSCKLLIERNDPILGMLAGGASVMQEGEFTFQRSGEEGAGNGWSVTPQFSSELRQAVLKH